MRLKVEERKEFHAKTPRKKRIQARDKFGEFDQEKDFLDLPLLFFAPLREILFYSKSTAEGKKIQRLQLNLMLLPSVC